MDNKEYSNKEREFQEMDDNWRKDWDHIDDPGRIDRESGGWGKYIFPIIAVVAIAGAGFFLWNRQEEGDVVVSSLPATSGATEEAPVRIESYSTDGVVITPDGAVEESVTTVTPEGPTLVERAENWVDEEKEKLSQWNEERRAKEANEPSIVERAENWWDGEKAEMADRKALTEEEINGFQLASIPTARRLDNYTFPESTAAANALRKNINEHDNTFEASGYAVVTTDRSDLNVRTGPSTEFDEITQVHKGSRHEVLLWAPGEGSQLEKDRWYLIADGKRVMGWVSGDYLDTSDVELNY